MLAFRASVVVSFPGRGTACIKPTLGGSDELRGLCAASGTTLGEPTAETAGAFSMLDMALFADAGKVVPLKRDIGVSRLHYSGGIGFRVRLRSAIVTRIDLAGSSEGLRMIWTFSDIFHPNF